MSGDGEALTGLWFIGQKHFGETLPEECREGPLPVFRETEEWLRVYFGGAAPGFTPKLSPRGTPFRKAVWDILLTVPYGKTVTYGEIASALAARRGGARIPARAVGGAVAHNPVSLLIPCHRVVGADGSLTGYAGGLERKKKLLAMEQGIG